MSDNRELGSLFLLSVMVASIMLCRAMHAQEQDVLSDRAVLPPKLSLAEAIRIAVAANKDVRMAALEADKAEALVAGAEGEFDPAFFAEASGGRIREPIADVPVDRREIRESAVSAGVRKRIITGTEIEVSSSTRYTRDEGADESGDPEYATRASLLVRQDLLRDFGTGANRTAILLQRNNSRIALESLRDELIQNLFEVERAYWELYFSLADLRVRDKQLQRAKELVKIAEARVDVGDAPPIEITRAQSSAAIQAVEIVDARNRIAKVRRQLLRVMGILDEKRMRDAFEPSDAPPTEPLSVSLAEAVAVATNARPDLARAARRIENAAFRERYAKNQRLPALQAYGEISLLGLDEELDAQTFLPEADEPGWEVGLVLEVPFPNRAARARLHAARLEREQAEIGAAALLEHAMREVADAVGDLRAAAERMTSAAEACALARRLLEAEEKSFSLGRTESFNVLDAQAALAAAERDEVRARTDYAVARANVYRVRGDLLEARHIIFVPGERDWVVGPGAGERAAP